MGYSFRKGIRCPARDRLLGKLPWPQRRGAERPHHCLASTSYVGLAIDQPLCFKKLAIVDPKQPLLHESSVQKSSWLRCRSTSAACCAAELLRGQSIVVRQLTGRIRALLAR